MGFFSLGVYTITSDDDWTAAVADIERNLRESRDRFPESVVDQSSFLVEEYITGEEFAVDVYFDGEGEPVILNIFTHRFASLTGCIIRVRTLSKRTRRVLRRFSGRSTR